VSRNTISEKIDIADLNKWRENDTEIGRGREERELERESEIERREEIERRREIERRGEREIRRKERERVKRENVKKRTDEFQRRVVAIVWGKARKENVFVRLLLRGRTNGTMNSPLASRLGEVEEGYVKNIEEYVWMLLKRIETLVDSYAEKLKKKP
jgi:hypothetical protein